MTTNHVLYFKIYIWQSHTLASITIQWEKRMFLALWVMKNFRNARISNTQPRKMWNLQDNCGILFTHESSSRQKITLILNDKEKAEMLGKSSLLLIPPKNMSVVRYLSQTHTNYFGIPYLNSAVLWSIILSIIYINTRLSI